MFLQKWMQGLSLLYFSFKESFLISIIDSVSQLVIKLQHMVALDAEEGVLKTFYAMLVSKLNILNCMYKHQCFCRPENQFLLYYYANGTKDFTCYYALQALNNARCKTTDNS